MGWSPHHGTPRTRSSIRWHTKGSTANCWGIRRHRPLPSPSWPATQRPPKRSRRQRARLLSPCLSTQDAGRRYLSRLRKCGLMRVPANVQARPSESLFESLPRRTLAIPVTKGSCDESYSGSFLRRLPRRGAPRSLLLPAQEALGRPRPTALAAVSHDGRATRRRGRRTPSTLRRRHSPYDAGAILCLGAHRSPSVLP